MQLPVLEEVRWEGWEMDCEVEEDLWEEMRALNVRVQGWCERRMRDWLRLVEEEKRWRREWFKIPTDRSKFGASLGRIPSHL